MNAIVVVVSVVPSVGSPAQSNPTMVAPAHDKGKMFAIAIAYALVETKVFANMLPIGSKSTISRIESGESKTFIVSNHSCRFHIHWVCVHEGSL